MKERWILTGKFMNGDKYFDSFDSIYDLTHTMEQIYKDWQTSLNLIEPDECINPFTLSMEQDLTDEERIAMSEQGIELY